MNVVQLRESNFRDTTATLRAIADQIDAGEHGEVGSLGLVLLGNRMEVFGIGPDSEGPSVALLLHAGFMRLSKSLEEHESL